MKNQKQNTTLSEDLNDILIDNKNIEQKSCSQQYSTSQ